MCACESMFVCEGVCVHVCVCVVGGWKGSREREKR